MTKQNKSVKLPIIGVIRTGNNSIENMPIQSAAAKETGIAELFPEYADGLLDLDGFSHVMLLFHLHKQTGYSLHVKPFMDENEHGVFATRSPKRPAPVGLSLVRVLSVDGNKVHFEGADMLDGSPLIDIKPYFKNFDNRDDAISGWLEDKDEATIKKIRSDSRFA